MPTDFGDLEQKLKRVERYLTKDVYRIIGVEAVKWFKQSFVNEGFTDKSLKKWKDVKRRDSKSGWYGFKYGATAKRPGQQKRSKDSMTNFSKAATKRKVLSGETKELKNSIQYKVNAGSRKVIVFSDKVYAEIHNDGGKVKVFGKATAKMPQRQFMGKSEMLREKLEKIIQEDIYKIMNA